MKRPVSLICRAAAKSSVFNWFEASESSGKAGIWSSPVGPWSGHGSKQIRRSCRCDRWEWLRTWALKPLSYLEMPPPNCQEHGKLYFNMFQLALIKLRMYTVLQLYIGMSNCMMGREDQFSMGRIRRSWAASRSLLGFRRFRRSRSFRLGLWKLKKTGFNNCHCHCSNLMSFVPIIFACAWIGAQH